MSYERVLAAFPRRQLAIAKSRQHLVTQILAFLGFLLFAGLGGAAVVNYLPPLVNDWSVGDNGDPIPGSWGGWNCTIHRGVIASCTVEAHFVGAGADKSQQFREVPMLFFGRPDRNAPVTILRDRTNPERVATSLGESYLTDRWITLGVIAGILAALAAACFWGVLASRRTQRTRRDLAAAPNPTLVTLSKVQRAKGAATWTFSWNAGAAQFTRKDTLTAPPEPLVVDPAGAYAVALTDARGRAMLVNAGIANLQLTDAERQAVFDAIQREQPRPAPATHGAVAAPR